MASNSRSTDRWQRRATAFAGLLALLGLAAAARADDNASRLYIVQLAGAPAVAAPALARRDARQFNPRAADVRRYAQGLVADHDAVLASIGVTDKLYSYRYTLNGFAARLTPSQARALASRPGVLRVWEDRIKHTSSNASARYLGLADPDAGLGAARGLTGDGVVIAVIDSGIVPEHPSFSDMLEASRPRVCRSVWSETSLLGRWLCLRFRRREPTLVFQRPTDWSGACEAGPGFASTACNNKLIGARYFVDGFLQEYALDANEFLSPRDADGHGSHIASVAAGVVVKATIGGTRVDSVRGMAPRAWLAAYKACWLEPGSLRGACSVADLTSAIEAAVRDGVDIINYSVGSDDGIIDPDDLALLEATGAGVLAVAAAGNDGPVPETIDSPAAAPWTIAVGAATRSGDLFQTALAIDQPADLAGRYSIIEAGFTPALGDRGRIAARLVLADDGVSADFDDGSTGTTDDACETLANGTELSGQVALIARGGCDFADKIDRAADAGAVAVVVYNSAGAPLIMKGPRGSVSIPAVMVSRGDGDRFVAALADDAELRITLERGLIRTVRDTGNRLEPLSSRGPNAFVPDVLKPDVVAPGVNILGAHTPDSANNQRGERFQYLSGTSMAVPHVAGVAALLKQAHTDWSPAALHSAIVTSARNDVLRTDGSEANPFDVGAGYLNPNAAVAPGLVYDRTVADYDAFLCAADAPREGVDCNSLPDGLPGNALDLNLPGIAVSDLVASATVRRRVTNVGEPGSFTANVDAPPGIGLAVDPPSVSLGTGESADFTLTVTAGDAPFEQWQFGSLTWTGGGATVRSPLAVRAFRFGAEPEVELAGASGNDSIAIRAGYTGSYAASLSGFQTSGASQPGAIRDQLQDAFVRDDGDLATGYGFAPPGSSVPGDVRRFPIVVPANTRLLRVAILADDTNGEHDLDLYLYRCPGLVVCPAPDEYEPAVAGGLTDEIITVLDPPAGEYFVDVHGFETAGNGATFTLSVWTPGADLGNASLTVPDNVLAGDSLELPLSWSGLPPGRALGVITHRDPGTGTELGYSVIRIDAD